MCRRKGWPWKGGDSAVHYQSRSFSSTGPIPLPVWLPITKNVTAPILCAPTGCWAEEKFPKAQHTTLEIMNAIRTSWNKAPNLQCKKQSWNEDMPLSLFPKETKLIREGQKHWISIISAFSPNIWTRWSALTHLYRGEETTKIWTSWILGKNGKKMADWIKGRVGCVPPLKGGSYSFQFCKGNPPAAQGVPAAAHTVTVLQFYIYFQAGF